MEKGKTTVERDIEDQATVVDDLQKVMKILLVQPPETQAGAAVGFNVSFSPLALQTIAGSLNDFDVRLIDCRFDVEIIPEIDSFRPDVVAVSALTPSVDYTNQLFSEVKELDPGVLTIVGGIHATFDPGAFQTGATDVIVMGEGDFSFRKVLEKHRKISRGRRPKDPFSEIEGICYRSGSTYLQNSRPKLIRNMDLIPFPNRKIIEKYAGNYSWFGSGAPTCIETSRGCPNKCSFCCSAKLYGGEYRQKSAERILAEIKASPTDFILFIDNNFIVKENTLRELCALIKAEDIKRKYACMTTPDSVLRNKTLIETLSGVGLEAILVGFEEIEPRRFDKLGTTKTFEKNSGALEILKAQGLVVIGSFIVNPDYTHDDFERLRSFIEKTDIDFFALTILTPFVGSELYEANREKLLNADLRKFDGFNLLLPTRLEKEEFYKEFMKTDGFNLFHSRNLLEKRSSYDSQIFPFSVIFENYKRLRRLSQT